MAECDFSSTILLIKFRSVGFCEEGKTREYEEKNDLLAQVYVHKPATNKLKPPIYSSPGMPCGTDICLLFFI